MKIDAIETFLLYLSALYTVNKGSNILFIIIMYLLIFIVAHAVGSRRKAVASSELRHFENFLGFLVGKRILLPFMNERMNEYEYEWKYCAVWIV